MSSSDFITIDGQAVNVDHIVRVYEYDSFPGEVNWAVELLNDEEIRLDTAELVESVASQLGIVLDVEGAQS